MMHGSEWILKYDDRYNDTRSTVTRWSFDNDQRHVTAFRPISEAAHSWPYDNVSCIGLGRVGSKFFQLSSVGSVSWWFGLDRVTQNGPMDNCGMVAVVEFRRLDVQQTARAPTQPTGSCLRKNICLFHGRRTPGLGPRPDIRQLWSWRPRKASALSYGLVGTRWNETLMHLSTKVHRRRRR